MSEIIKQVKADANGDVVITADHTIADIARWVIENDWHDDFLWCMQQELAERAVDKEQKLK